MRLIAPFALLLSLSGIAQAAKVTTTVTVATQYTDGTPVASIGQVRVTWGPCANGSQASVQAQYVEPGPFAPGSTVTVPTFPVGLSPVCFVAYNSDANGVESGPTNAVVFTPSPALTQPVQLGQPITLP